MVNLCLKLFPIFLIFSTKKLYSNNLFTLINNRTELLLIFIIIGFMFLVLLFFFIHHIINLKRENSFRLYLNLENMWNSAPMLESRQKAAQLITDDLLHSKDPADKDLIHHAKVIVDFFNHIGLQVYQDIIDFGHIYNLLGQEIMDYWDNKNYKMLVHYEKHKMYHAYINPWVGFEYLSDISFQQNEYLHGSLWMPASFSPMDYQPVQEKVTSYEMSNRNTSFNIYLIIFSFLAFISLVIFLFSYLFYSGYF